MSFIVKGAAIGSAFGPLGTVTGAAAGIAVLAYVAGPTIARGETKVVRNVVDFVHFAESAIVRGATKVVEGVVDVVEGVVDVVVEGVVDVAESPMFRDPRERISTVHVCCPGI
jgi:hypothetical protein